jgi:PAS domain S-box-containing protein
MRLSIKSLLFIGILFVTIAAGLIYVRVSQENLLNEVFSDRETQRRVVFNKVFDLSEKQIETLSKDYTYWDEMVDFTTTKDQAFAEDNLDTSLSTYGASGVWVYGLDNQLVYSVRQEGEDLVKSTQIPLSTNKISEIFAEKRLTHFYLKSENGILDVFGATIHPSDDSERKTDPKGYFFAARLLDKELLADISDSTAAKISVETNGSNIAEKKIRQGSLTFYKPLLGLDNKPISYLKVDSQFDSVRKFATSSDRDFLIFFALAIGFFIATLLVIYLQDKSVEHAMKIAEVMTANLTESEARFRAMNDASPFGIFVTDPKGKCIYTNTAYQKISGQTQEQSWGDGWTSSIHPDDRQRVYAEWYSSAHAGGEYSSEHRFKQENGKEIWARVKADSIRVEDKLLGYIGVVEEITESKHHSEEIEARNSELERLNKNMVDRELKMIELKKEIEKLKKGKKNED